ncbi:TPR-like protein [Auriculariales sp. MPI-PUGE-AT-0066]|nr:TPR-like protein [Auriculariales sp. MPI-PUGE-AT-0066]
MAFQALVNNADCGPSTALQNLGKQFERDRGVQADLFGRAGSSRETFRSAPAPLAPERLQEAADFFQQQQQQPSAHHGAHMPFDMQLMRESLRVASPAAQSTVRQPLHTVTAPTSANWAADFLQSPVPSISHQKQPHAQQQFQHTQPHFPGATAHFLDHRSILQPGVSQQIPFSGLDAQYRLSQSKGKGRADVSSVQWEQQFMSITKSEPQVAKEQHKEQPVVAADDLSRAAALLLDAVRDDKSDKFAKSEFMGFMRKLRDRDVVVEGDQFVERTPDHDEALSITQEQSNQGQRSSHIATPAARIQPMNSSQFMVSSQTTSDQPMFEVEQESESELDAYLRRDNADYQRFWQDAQASQASSSSAAAAASKWSDPRTAEWDALQQGWDAFEATATGMQPVARGGEDYIFQTENPYLVGESSTFRSAAHADGVYSASAFQAAAYASVLEKEARVQRDPSNAQAWYELGVRQQESEREQKAVQALTRAVEIDPSLLPAWMALAVSHCNEGRRDSACNAIEHWVAVRLNRPRPSHSPSATSHGSRVASPIQHERLVEDLLTIVRAAPDPEQVDADVQIALAVLFHTTEEYEKALDCFKTALAVRPNDALLYNRVGATLANSGRSDEALVYYARALELTPAYVRAEFNTGIALVNMSRLEDGARHLLNALSLQETESGYGSGDGTAVTSGQMWDLLRSCVMRMRRMDLAACCERHDLEGFRAAFARDVDETET